MFSREVTSVSQHRSSSGFPAGVSSSLRRDTALSQCHVSPQPWSAQHKPLLMLFQYVLSIARSAGIFFSRTMLRSVVQWRDWF